MSDKFNKSFSFSIDSPLFKKSAEVLVFCMSAGSNSIYWYVPSRSSKQFWNFVLGAKLSECCYTHITLKQMSPFFARKLLQSAFKLEFARLL